MKRPADDEFFRLATADQFGCVLTACQMGQVEPDGPIGRRFQDQGGSTAIIDLTGWAPTATYEE